MPKKLKKYKKQEGLDVPENYFDDFALKMQNTIGNTNEKKASWINIITYNLQLRWTLPTFILIALMVFAIRYENRTEVAVNDEELRSYLMTELDWEQDYELYQLSSNQESELQLSDEELLYYLNQELGEMEQETLLK